MAREDEIRLIAYNIWQEEGCVDGRDCEQWLRAEIIWSRREREKALAKNAKPNSGKSNVEKPRPSKSRRKS